MLSQSNGQTVPQLWCRHSTTEVSTRCNVLCWNCVLPELIKSVRQQRQTVGTSKTFLLHDHASAHKAKVAVTFLEKQNIQVLAHPSPYSPDSAQCDFWLVPHIIESWLGEAKYPGSGPSPLQSWLGSMWLLVGPPHRRKVGWWIFSRNQDLTKAVTSEHHALSLSDYQNAALM